MNSNPSGGPSHFVALAPSRARWRSHGPDFPQLRLAAYANAGLAGSLIREDDPQLATALGGTTPLLAFSPSPTSMQLLAGVAQRRPVVIWLSPRYAIDHRRWTTACPTGQAALLSATNRLQNERAREVAGGILATEEIHTVVSSQWLRSTVAFDTGVEPANLQVVADPLDQDRAPGWRREALRKLLAVGDFSSPGRNDLLITTLTRLSQSDPGLSITLRGCGDWFASETASLRDIHGLTLQNVCSSPPQMLALYQDHDALLHLDRVGARAFAVSDAMASGLVVITHEVGAVTEYVDASSASILAQASNPHAAVAAVLDLRTETARFRDMSGHAISRAEADRSPVATTNREIELIRSLL